MSLKIIFAQLNFFANDIEGNTQKVIEAIEIAENEQWADLIIFPEMTLTFYPNDDLWAKPDLDKKIQIALQKIQNLKTEIGVILGFPRKEGEHLYNQAALVQKGEIVTSYKKQCLPNQHVFDEKRYFQPGSPKPCVFNFKDTQLGLIICEDAWHKEPAQQVAEAGAESLIVINASPFTHQKHTERLEILKQHASKHSLSVAYCNWAGAQDEIIFDGGSFILDPKGKVTQQAPFFKAGLYKATLNQTAPISHDLPSPLSKPQAIYEALVLGTRDYMYKNGFKTAIIGLSGGIDSALTLSVAVDAIGKDHVTAIMIPSRFTSKESLELAKKQAELLGTEYHVFSIDSLFNNYLEILNSTEKGMTAENLQARCRGTLLMGYSNQSPNSIVLCPSNKSETAVGYTTLYGDMVGGFSVLKDVYKTMVYEIAEILNQKKPTILPEIIKRAPSAELSPGQTDEDTLPPYPVLDKILEAYIESNKSFDEIVEMGFDQALVKDVLKKIQISEYKRYQSPVGPKVTPRAFGKDWRYPITKTLGC